MLTKRRRSLPSFLILLCLVCTSGATCQRPLMTNPFVAQGPAAPQVLQPGASRDQIVAAVKQNSARVQSLSVSNASITIPDMMGLPILNGNIAAERPGRFRLKAGSIAGPELDLGSNDELFWLWVRRNQPPAVYFCRHSQFANSNIRQMRLWGWWISIRRLCSMAHCRRRAGMARSSCAPGWPRRAAPCNEFCSSTRDARGSLSSMFTIRPGRLYWQAHAPNRIGIILSSRFRCRNA